MGNPRMNCVAESTPARSQASSVRHLKANAPPCRGVCISGNRSPAPTEFGMPATPLRELPELTLKGVELALRFTLGKHQVVIGPGVLLQPLSAHAIDCPEVDRLGGLALCGRHGRGLDAVEGGRHQPVRVFPPFEECGKRRGSKPSRRPGPRPAPVS